MDINHELLARIRSALNREMSISIGLANEIIVATTHHARCAQEAREAERRLGAWPRDPRHAAMTAEELNAADIAAAEQRRAARQLERVTGRPLVSEQRVLQDLADATRRVGGNVDVAVAQYVRATAGAPDHQTLQTAWEAAVAARVNAERQLAELEQERAAHGRRAGQLRTTLHEASRWMGDNGMTMEDAA